MSRDSPGPSVEQSLMEDGDLFFSRVTRQVAALGVLAELPFVIYHALYGSRAIVALVLSLIVCQLIVFRLMRETGRGRSGAHVLALFHTSAAVIAANLLGFSSSYWLFATTVANAYILPLRSALIVNGISLLMVVPLVFQNYEPGTRFLVCLLLVNLSGLVFSNRMAEQRAALQRLLFLDPLTGTGNRRALDQAIDAVENLFVRHEIPAALLVFDLGPFKDGNDEYGHRAGDVLRSAVRAIQGRLRVNDALYRYDEGQFVVLARNTELDGALALAEDLRRVVESSKMPGGVALTPSIGVAAMKPNEDSHEWFRRADRNLYQAKRHGRNQICA